VNKYNVLVYRNNSTWSALANDLEALAQAQPNRDEKRMIVAQALIKVFSEHTSEADIAAWLIENAEQINKAGIFYCDQTTSQIAVAHRIKGYTSTTSGKFYASHRSLEELVGNVVENRVFKNRSPAGFYKQVFALLPGVGVKHVQIVLENIGDYNPLQITEFGEGYRLSEENKKRYATEFAVLMPDSMSVEFVSINDLVLPNNETIVLCHHHAFNDRSEEIKKLQDQHPHLVEPYIARFFYDISCFCNIGSVIDTDILAAVRDSIEHATTWDYWKYRA